jgi:hypothetical protein
MVPSSVKNGMCCTMLVFQLQFYPPSSPTCFHQPFHFLSPGSRYFRLPQSHRLWLPRSLLQTVPAGSLIWYRIQHCGVESHSRYVFVVSRSVLVFSVYRRLLLRHFLFTETIWLRIHKQLSPIRSSRQFPESVGLRVPVALLVSS